MHLPSQWCYQRKIWRSVIPTLNARIDLYSWHPITQECDKNKNNFSELDPSFLAGPFGVGAGASSASDSHPRWGWYTCAKSIQLTRHLPVLCNVLWPSSWLCSRPLYWVWCHLYMDAFWLMTLINVVTLNKQFSASTHARTSLTGHAVVDQQHRRANDFIASKQITSSHGPRKFPELGRQTTSDLDERSTRTRGEGWSAEHYVRG